MESHPELRGCVVSCVACGIRFLTHPRNAGRRNLRCPFGCRQHHRRQHSSQRSTAYYQTAAGKAKKKRLNARRQGCLALPAAQSQPNGDPQGMSPALQVAPCCAAVPAPPVSESSPAAAELPREFMALDEASVAKSPMLPYVRMVVSLVEGVEFTCREVVHLLWQTLRQRSIGAGREVDYLVSFLHRQPP